MQRGRTVLAMVALALPLVTVTATASTQSTAGPASAGSVAAEGSYSSVAVRARTHRLIPAPGQHALPRGNGTVSSSNWSGYAVVANGITEVRSTFVVPALKPFPKGFASTWAGIGGFGPSDLIQAGFSEEVGQNYYAWFELLPDYARQITGCAGDSSCSVRPGDRAYVRIYKKATNLWNISMGNTGHGVTWSWVRDVVYSSSQSSAEWILEAPTLLVFQSQLANVGTVNFGPTNLYKIGAASGGISRGNPVRIVLVQAGVRQATPSSIATDGVRFNDCAWKRVCAKPT